MQLGGLVSQTINYVSPPITVDSVLVAGYVDNFGALSGDPELARSSAERIRDELVSMGLPVHPLEGYLDNSCCDIVGVLGLQFDRQLNRLANRPEHSLKVAMPLRSYAVAQLCSASS